MNVFKATLDTRHQNGVIGTITQFDNAVLELQIVADGQVGDAWESPQFELIAMKRDLNPVCEVYQDRFTILNKEEHKVQIELKEQFLTCRGTVKMQLVVKDGSRLSTTLFYLIIGQSLDHDIVESHRDVKVLDDLEAYVKQGFDDLAFQEQRMAAVEQSTNDLNDTMNANEAERNKSEITRQKTFDINEAHRTRTFNNQVEEQGAAFSNAQTQREKDFSESQQNISQAFETSQRERESAFNKAQELNQTTFTNNETKRQTAFNQSQTANQQDFVDNEAERQRLFETNESSRQKSESQRVKNESERVFAETQRADAEVIRKQKMTEFEEKATQLSEDLDNQVARVDKFVAANEEKLLGPHDKTDYMGNAHKSVKDANDANVEYILGEVNTVHYEGQHITATDTIEKQVRSAILKGQTLVNLLNDYNSGQWRSTLVSDTDFITFFNMNDKKVYFDTAQSNNSYKKSIVIEPYGVFTMQFTSEEKFRLINLVENHGWTSENYTDCKVVMLKGDYTNVDIPYFTGMKSVKLPVLTTVGKNLNPTSIEPLGLYDSTGANNNNSTHCRTDDFINVTPNKVLTVSSDHQINRVFGYDTDGNYLGMGNGGIIVSYGFADKKQHTFTVPNNCHKIKITSFVNTNTYFQLEEGTTATNYEPFKSNILTVNEPVELRGIDEVKDTLDLLTGEVVQNIGEIVLDGSEGVWYQHTGLSTDEYDVYWTSNNFIPSNGKKAVCDKLSYSNPTTPNTFRVNDSGGIFIGLNKGANLIEWLSQNTPKIQYSLTEKSVKTVDLSGQKVYSYDGTTHYSCSAAEGALVPTLSIDVPTNLPALVSRQRTTIESQKEQIITLEQENEQLIAQNEVQDIDISLNQDAINFMLFAPATMSLNDESRNNEGVNAMAAYLANQILKGKLDYSLVVSRYGTYKEDIDTILIAEGKQDLIK